MVRDGVGQGEAVERLSGMIAARRILEVWMVSVGEMLEFPRVMSRGCELLLVASSELRFLSYAPRSVAGRLLA